MRHSTVVLISKECPLVRSLARALIDTVGNLALNSDVLISFGSVSRAQGPLLAVAAAAFLGSRPEEDGVGAAAARGRRGALGAPPSGVDG